MPPVADMISRNRFNKFNQYFHLNDNAKAVAKGESGYDPLYKVRLLLDSVLKRSQTRYYPGQNISLDEATIKFNGWLSFKQCIKGECHNCFTFQSPPPQKKKRSNKIRNIHSYTMNCSYCKLRFQTVRPFFLFFCQLIIHTRFCTIYVTLCFPPTFPSLHQLLHPSHLLPYSLSLTLSLSLSFRTLLFIQFDCFQENRIHRVSKFGVRPIQGPVSRWTRTCTLDVSSNRCHLD